VTEPLIADFEVEFPFVHSTGPALGRFFTALRDDRVIWGRRCETCDRVVVPAQDYCETCSGDLVDWVEVGPEGTLVGFAVIGHAMPLAGLDPPFAFVRVRLDGAGTDLLHLASDVKGLKHGARVRPVWADERSGTIRDIAGFEVVR
jgi:uncharacterized OB-fold protein